MAGGGASSKLGLSEWLVGGRGHWQVLESLVSALDGGVGLRLLVISDQINHY